MIPAEIIKYNKGLIINDLCILLNYMMEQEEFPDSWAEGVRSSIHKSGPLLDQNITGGLPYFQYLKRCSKLLYNDNLSL